MFVPAAHVQGWMFSRVVSAQVKAQMFGLFCRVASGSMCVVGPSVMSRNVAGNYGPAY